MNVFNARNKKANFPFKATNIGAEMFSVTLKLIVLKNRIRRRPVG